MWKVLNQDVDLGEPTSFLYHVYLGCTQRQCEISKDIVDNYRPCLNHEFPREELKNYHDRKICVFLRGHMTWKVMPRNVWNDIVSWQTKQLNNSTKYQLPRTHSKAGTNRKEPEDVLAKLYLEQKSLVT